MRGLRKDLEVMPIPGVSADEEKAKGPTAPAHGEGGEDLRPRQDRLRHRRQHRRRRQGDQKKQEEAAAAEAAAKEIAGLHHGRATDWTKAVQDARKQEDQVVAWRKLAVTLGKRGGLEAGVNR